MTTQPTPEQLTKWREEAEHLYAAMGFTHGFDDGAKCYEAGYIRAKQEDEQAMKLMEKAANISAQHARKQALEDAIDLFPQGFAMLTTNQVREIIKELLK